MEIASVPYKSILNGSNIMKPNYHLNYGKKRIERAIKNKKSFTPLGDAVRDVFTGGIFKRVFVEKEEFGLPYISAQHMMNSNPLEVAKTISKKYTPRQEDMTLRSSQILVSCAGTVGNVRLIGEDLDGVIGSQDIIRVISDEDSDPYGFIYAYLASPTAYNYIQSYIYGSVVPRIEPNTLAKLPVPNFSDRLKQEIHNLIVEATNLRVEANKLLREAVEKVESDFSLNQSSKIYSVNVKEILAGDKFTKEARLESDYYQPRVKSLIQEIKKRNWVYLGDVSNEINRSGLRERKFVNEGVPLVTGQNLNMARLVDLKMLSRKFTRNIEKNTTASNEILVSVQGTIGKIEYVYKNMYENVFASEQLSKIQIDIKKIHPGYVACFLKGKLGEIQLLKHKTGSVIEWVKENNIASVVISMPDDKGQAIGEKYNKATLMIEEAFQKENQAIDLVEKEIESWQK